MNGEDDALNGGVSAWDESGETRVLAALTLRELVRLRRDLLRGSLGERSGVGKEPVDGLGEAVVLTRLTPRIVRPSSSL